MGAITSADAVLMLTVETIFPVPQQLQGFAADDIYNVPAIRSVETQMGVDGVLSGGFVFAAIPQTITLQADSASNAVFDAWWTQMQATKGTYRANGIIRLPSIGLKFTQVNGFLTSYTPVPAGRRTLQPRTYEITWESAVPSPV